MIGAFDLPVAMIGAGPFGVGPHAIFGLDSNEALSLMHGTMMLSHDG